MQGKPIARRAHRPPVPNIQLYATQVYRTVSSRQTKSASSHRITPLQGSRLPRPSRTLRATRGAVATTRVQVQ